MLDAFGGTAVGAVFLAEDRPVAAHVFGRRDLFAAALPDLLHGLGLEAGAPAPQRSTVDPRARALAWLREAARTGTGWSESHGAGFETTLVAARVLTLGHAVLDEQRTLVHAAFYVATGAPAAAQVVGPVGDTDENGRGARVRPTVAEERRRGRAPEAGKPGDRAPQKIEDVRDP
jgi:hypothetical protein